MKITSNRISNRISWRVIFNLCNLRFRSILFENIQPFSIYVHMFMYMCLCLCVYVFCLCICICVHEENLNETMNKNQNTTYSTVMVKQTNHFIYKDTFIPKCISTSRSHCGDLRRSSRKISILVSLFVVIKEYSTYCLKNVQLSWKQWSRAIESWQIA